MLDKDIIDASSVITEHGQFLSGIDSVLFKK